MTHLTGWVLAGTLFLVVTAGLRGWTEGLLRTLVNLAFLMTLFYFNARVLINRFFETKRYKALIVSSVALVLVAAAVRVWCELHFFGGSLFNNNLPPTDGGRRMFAGFVMVFALLLFFSALYQFVENRNALILQHSELEARHAEARLLYLKAQINPHFLFNTLNNIYAAATLQHPATPAMVLRLSELLRYVTYEGQGKTVPLSSEAAQIALYLELYSWKSPDPLPIQFKTEGELSEGHIEPLLLLPFVENALKHSDLDEQPDGAFCHIFLRCNADKGLLFEVKNTFNPDDRQKDQVGGVGLENVRQRLELRYGPEHVLVVHTLPGTAESPSVFSVQLEIQPSALKMA